MDVNRIGSNRWGMIFALLSMDVIEPYYEDMGLVLDNKHEFIILLREQILKNRRVFESDPNVIPPLSETVLARLDACFGRSFTLAFYHWATEVFTEVHADHPQWSAWEIIIREWAFGDPAELNALPEEKAIAVLTKYIEMVDVGDVENQIAETKDQPLSLWDMEMYAIHGFADDDINDPFANVIYTIEMNRFRNYWHFLSESLTGVEKDKLREEAQRKVDELEVWLPGPLQAMDSLWREDADDSQ